MLIILMIINEEYMIITYYMLVTNSQGFKAMGAKHNENMTPVSFLSTAYKQDQNSHCDSADYMNR